MSIIARMLQQAAEAKADALLKQRIPATQKSPRELEWLGYDVMVEVHEPHAVEVRIVDRRTGRQARVSQGFGKAVCHPEDTWDLFTGLAIAYGREYVKAFGRTRTTSKEGSA